MWDDFWKSPYSIYFRMTINPRCSMYGIFTYIWVIYRVNVGKYPIHGASGNRWYYINIYQSLPLELRPWYRHRLRNWRTTTRRHAAKNDCWIADLRWCGWLGCWIVENYYGYIMNYNDIEIDIRNCSNWNRAIPLKYIRCLSEQQNAELLSIASISFGFMVDIIYFLVMTNSQTICYWRWPLKKDLSIKDADFIRFPIVVYMFTWS